MQALGERIQNYWDKRSRGFSAVRQRELASSDAAAWQGYICQFLPPKKQLQVLDVGTGPGFLAILMARLGHRVTGIDSSGGMIQQARRNAAENGVFIDFSVADAQQLEFPDAQFDLVLSRNLTWNLPDVAKAYREWQRVLRPGGLLLNFDSDYGSVRFTKTARNEENIHHDIENSVLKECDTLKDALAISRENRPAWDRWCLEKLGFKNCQCERDIRSRVHTSPEMQYDSAPIFCLQAEK